jgi:hypothetical protein
MISYNYYNSYLLLLSAKLPNAKMQFFNVALWSSTILAIAQAAPSPMQFGLSVNVKEGGSTLTQDPVCLRICWSEILTCPDGWVSEGALCLCDKALTFLILVFK